MYCKIVTVRRTLRSETATSFSAVGGAPYTGGPGQTAPVAPPPSAALETTVLDHGRGQELLMKEALHIQMTPVEGRFNRDGGLEVPGCWTAVIRRQGGRSNPHQPLTSNDVYPR